MADVTLKQLFTQIADAIRSHKKEEKTSIAALDFPTEIANIKGGGTDTSDATLDNAKFLLKGKSAYAKEIKYEGSMKELPSVAHVFQSQGESFIIDEVILQVVYKQFLFQKLLIQNILQQKISKQLLKLVNI